MSAEDNNLLILAECQLESTLESVDWAEEKVVQVSQKEGLSEEDTFRLGYSVREAVVNAVVHGNRYSANKKVTFRIGRSGNSIVVFVRDHGDGFQLQALADPLADENLLSQSGRGMTLIRAFVDEFRVGPAEGGGTLAVLRKKLPPGTGGA